MNGCPGALASALDPDPAAMPLDDTAADRESEPEPGIALGRRVVRPPERFEDRRLRTRRETDAVVTNNQEGAAVVRPQRQADLTAVGRVLGGVVEEVAEDLFETIRVGADRARQRVDDDRDSLAVAEARTVRATL